MLYEVCIAGLDDFEIKLLGKKVRRNHLLFIAFMFSKNIFEKRKTAR